MAKKITGLIKLQIKGAQATAAPPVGPALGQRAVNIAMFVKEFNARTQKQAGEVLPTVITVYSDKSFTFITKTSPASNLLKKAAKIESASKTPGKAIAGSVTEKQVEEIAKIKLPDLNCYDIEAAKKLIKGSARSMGLEIKG
ncbi:50S ribosomal protein L11 [Silvanigrella sp.]|jgi:large subunit ribosomal protein L11|uniref:50S ribosomal protein L11 n=1 Tax=Silvanigrella sp. TaxID=2024976 RepID=UPI0037C9ECBE